MGSELNLGIVGAGSIGRRVAQGVQCGEIPYHLAAVYDVDAAAAERLADDFASSENIAAANLADCLRACDVLVEAAAGAAVGGIVSAARESFAKHGTPKHLLVMSVGGLLGVPLAEPGDDGPVIHVPSGAIGALDAVQAMMVAGLDEVTLTTRKPPAALGLDVTVETVVFEGAACDVIEKYPKNINVAIALSFAGIGPHRTRVRLIADPAESRNVHHIFAKGPAGEVEFTSRNMPFPDNPKTSYLAALSAVATLKRLASLMQVG